jgi:uncharacterized protein YjdB
MSYEGSDETAYVQAIWDRNGNCEREFDRPQGGGKLNQSGWKYSVDGTFPKYSCGDKEETLRGGEKIHWIYVVNAKDETLFRDVDSIKLNKSSLNLNLRGSGTLQATVNPSNATDREVVWSSNNESVATVDEDGKVKAVGSGTAVITAESADNEKFSGYPNYDASKNRDTCTVTVSGSGGGGGTDVSVTGVTLDKTSTTVEVGGTDKLTAAVAPSNATDQGLIWSSSDESVAAVDQNGIVTGVKVGTATITVKTKDGNKTDSCTVTVRDKGVVLVNIPGKDDGGLDLTITQNADGTVNINSRSKNPLDYITITLYDKNEKLVYINQATAVMNFNTVLAKGEYHGFVKASSTDKIAIPADKPNFTIQ